MSDAATGKLGFGALVLVVCAVTFMMRKPHEPGPVPVISQTPVIASMPQPPEAAPPDIQEGQPRIEYAFEDEQRARTKPRAAIKPARRTKASHLPAPRLHFVVATRRTARSATPHYPFDPHRRWQTRELP